ncbi:DegT/DnrJ/EryC1/StrS family aminotransferase [Vibrio aestuarianus]|uniref:DegT/DnrJ/EryC1/StrS family aminotransferase n=1 Tax=Vibrio aestuarianus TaxID=28171 RepID=UPI00237D096B|nr:DegT/DnrJ/EryC1/StrS family aminotransferase [Vibrio aestuarianus]MDE1326602.1 DegT/DnrJ/EryC1/StrS family aminotransferase [Vibrio aestuarianus]
MKKIRLSKSSIGEEEKSAVLAVLDKEFLGMGLEVKLFEEEIASYIGVDSSNVICVNTGTAALHLAVESMDIGMGDEVLVPSLTYVASFQAISATGAIPIACDVDENTCFIDIEDAERRITSRTKAIMPVHYASNSHQMPLLYDFANKYNLRVIEDAAHSFTSSRNGKMVGSEGDVICFSFDGIKNITSGEGGAIITSDLKVQQRIRDARLLGVENDSERRYNGERSWTFDVNHQGYRYHMSNIMAAIGREQLKKSSEFAKRRKEIAKRYSVELRELQCIHLLDLDFNEVTPHIFVVKVINGNRDKLRYMLMDKGIECGVHYQPNHYLSLYKSNYSLPVTELLSKQLLTLPMHIDLTDSDIDYIISVIKQVDNEI